jgi:acetyl esterase
MPLHHEARTLLDMMEAIGAPPLDSQPPAEARATRKALAAEPTEQCHEILEINAGGIPTRLYRAKPTGTTPGLLVFIHGGGWVIGDLDSHDNVCRSLANRSGLTVLSVDYRLAPEDPFPAGLDDCSAATLWAFEHARELGIDPTRIAIGGDSAGANIAAVVCHETTVPLGFQLLIYPVVDVRMNTDSYNENGEGYFLTKNSMQWFTDHYLSGGEGTPHDPRVSPLLVSDEVLAAGPPALVITAGFDPLRDEGIAYADRLSSVGVVVSHVHFSGQIHAFYSLPDQLGDARLAHALSAQALVAALGS